MALEQEKKTKGNLDLMFGDNLQGRKEFISNFGVKYILILMYSKKILNRGRK